jgi:tetratricopeptide (TPR) repeat protein
MAFRQPAKLRFVRPATPMILMMVQSSRYSISTRESRSRIGYPCPVGPITTHSANRGVIQLGYARFGAFAYSWSGDFIDKERWQEVRLESGSYGEVMMLIEQLLKASPSSHDLERLVRSIDRIEPTIPTLETKSRAQAKKLRGLCLEAQSDLENALRLYEDALNLDPKIGLKRRIAQLHKLLRTNDPSLKMEGK